jgi:hypothetical protein
MTNADLLKNMMKASQEGGKEVCRRQGVASEDEEVTPGEESKPQRSPFYCLPIRPERWAVAVRQERRSLASLPDLRQPPASVASN